MAWDTLLSLSPLWAELAVALLAVAVGVGLAVSLRRRRPRARPTAAAESLAELRLRALDGGEAFVQPSVILIPGRGQPKLRLGAHPPFMDGFVGHPEFQRLPFQDIRGDDETIRDLSRHAACVWRDERGACYIQLGWPGPGEVIRPRSQARVLHLGRPQDATSRPLRLAHRDVVRLASSVEYVFCEAGPVQDRPTPERKKVEVLEGLRVTGEP